MARPPPRSPPSLPDVGNYQLIKQIGTGAYATVFSARRKLVESSSQNPLVAVKCVSRQKLTKAREDAIVQEISVLKTLKHDNIVELSDFFCDNNFVYIITELCDGGDLHALIESRGPFAEPLARTYFRQIARGIEYYHSHGIVHLDLKPHNILITSAPVASKGLILKIADFGLAVNTRLADIGTSFRGSPAYTAPEVFEGMADARADLWSAGAILFEMLFKQTPYPATTVDELLVILARGESVCLPLSPVLSDHCQHLLMFLLMRNPDDRITFDDLFTHTFVDLPHYPSASSLIRAREVVRKAIEADQRHDSSVAYDFYCDALQHFFAAVEYETDETALKSIRETMSKYMSRAETLKSRIDGSMDELARGRSGSFHRASQVSV